MRKLAVFESVSLDGYFTDVNGDMSWAYNRVKDQEWDSFVSNNASGGGTLLFGRITYDHMVSYWPTPEAIKNDPSVARGMNKSEKVVFSRTLENTRWNNTRIVRDNIVAEVRKMKEGTGNGMVILGSGSIVSQLTREGLVDEFQFVVTPVVLGKGRTVFEGIEKGLTLKLTKSRTFRNGNVFLCYESDK